MRSKRWLLLGVALAGGLALYGATQVWVVLRLVPGAAAFSTLEVTGQQLNASLSPIAIAALAAALALTIAGKVFRRVLGALIALLGAGIAAISWSVLGAPERAASGRLAEATGLAGSSQLDLIASSEQMPFIALTIAAGLTLAVLGVLVLILSGKWRSAGRKYESDGESATAGASAPAAPKRRDENSERIDDWDAMNDGDDPTR